MFSQLLSGWSHICAFTFPGVDFNINYMMIGNGWAAVRDSFFPIGVGTGVLGSKGGKMDLYGFMYIIKTSLMMGSFAA